MGLTLTQNLLDLSDANKLSTAVSIVVFVTQAIQQLTGWKPAWFGALLSLLVALLSVVERPTQFWYENIGQIFVRACQIYCMAGGAAGAIALGMSYRSHRRKHAAKRRTVAAIEKEFEPEIELQDRPFWVRWF